MSSSRLPARPGFTRRPTPEHPTAIADFADFAETYADQNERDDTTLHTAVKNGTVKKHKRDLTVGTPLHRPVVQP